VTFIDVPVPFAGSVSPIADRHGAVFADVND